MSDCGYGSTYKPPPSLELDIRVNVDGKPTVQKTYRVSDTFAKPTATEWIPHVLERLARELRESQGTDPDSDDPAPITPSREDGGA